MLLINLTCTKNLYQFYGFTHNNCKICVIHPYILQYNLYLYYLTTLGDFPFDVHLVLKE